jgi:long-chain acyl-CoA synthetase
MYTTFSQIHHYSIQTPNKIAIINLDRKISYIELIGMIYQTMGHLIEVGTTLEELVGIETQDPIMHLVGCIAVMEYGAIAVPLPRESSNEFIDIINNLNIKTIVSTTFTNDKDTKVNYIGIDADFNAGSSINNYKPRNVSPENIAMIYHTSGTTSGIRKGVKQSYRMLFETAEYISDVMQMTGEVIEYIASPIDNAFWFGRCRVVIKNGGSLVLNKGVLNIFEIMLSIRDYHVNSISGDTSIFVMLLHHMKEKFCSVGKEIKWVKIASQAMHLTDKKGIIKCLPNAKIVMNYGLTEAMRCTLLSFNDFPEKLRSVGKSPKGVHVKIVNNDNYETGIGEIFISGTNLCSGYLDHDELWEKKYIDGWYATGDIGYLDDDDFLYITGRNDDALNVGGKTISPLEIEEVLSKYITNEIVVTSIESPENILVLVAQGDIQFETDWNTLKIKLFELLPSICVPKELYIAELLPKTSNGKVIRSRVLDRVNNQTYRKYND